MRAVLARGLIVTVVLGLALTGRAAAAGEEYANHVLTSNDTTVIPADNADPHLINPWGLVSSATSPWWTANNGTDSSTLYNALGVPFPATPLVVAVPRPTGIVFNGTAGAFPITGGGSSFIFDSEDGSVYGWRGGNAATKTTTKAGG